MDLAARELIVARIASGTVRLRVYSGRLDRVYVVHRPSLEQSYTACEVYDDVFRQAQMQEVYSDEELLCFMMEHGLWDESRQKLLAGLPKEIENFKVALFQATFKANERKTIRKALVVAKEKLGQLYSSRHSYDHISCSGAAAMAKMRFLVGCGLHHKNNRVFGDDDFWETDSSLLDDVLAAYSKSRLEEVCVRRLSRVEPWRQTWNTRGCEKSLFDLPACEHTDEQKALIAWSEMYDSVYQHPDCPPDEVVEDDDLLDGWLVVQRRKRESRLSAAEGDEQLGNERIRNSQEVYLVGETVDDARKIIDKNDDYGKVIQKQRFAHLKDKGQLSELEMPDTKLRLRQEATAKLSAAMNAKKG